MRNKNNGTGDQAANSSFLILHSPFKKVRPQSYSLPRRKSETEQRRGRHERAKKSKPKSHRYNHLPLLPSGPGGVQQELVVLTCHCKGNRRLTQIF